MLLELLATLIVSLISLYVWLYILEPHLFMRELLLIPKSQGHWLFGTISDFPKQGDAIWKNMQRRLKQYGPVHVVSFMWMRQVHLFTPDSFKAVMQSSTNITKSIFYNPLHPWLGISLLTSTGTRWKAKRRLLTPAFHFKILQNYLQVNYEQTTVFLDTMAEQCQKNQFVDVQSPVAQLTLDIIIRTAFDCTFSAQKGDVAALEYLQNLNELAHEYFETFQNGTALLPWAIYTRFTPGGRKYMQNIRKLHAFTLNVIQERIEQNKKGVASRKKYQDFLQTLLECKYEDGTDLSMEDVRAEVDTFMFEGHDTTSAGVMWILFCLADNPDVQAKARAEVVSVIAKRQHITHEDLSSMPYLTAVIKESLRVYPPVPFISRTLDEAMDVGGYRLPAGANVAINPLIVHYNPDVWPEPEKFKPERFAGDDDRHAYSYVPFSAGSRNCIGQVFAMNEMKSIAALTLRRFKIIPDVNRRPIIQPAVVLRSANGIHLRFEEIK